MQHIDTDKLSGAEIWRLSEDPRPTDNIYGEQPYNSADGTRITLRHYATDNADGGLSILDLTDGSTHTIIDTAPRFPAFHGCSEYLYCQRQLDDRLVLHRWHYQTLVCEEILDLPLGEGNFSYGTVSADHAHYAVCVHNEGGPCRVLHFDLATGAMQELCSTPDHYYKHEQFSRDGRNLVMIQANSPGVVRVELGAVTLAGHVTWFAADEPHTPRPSGHEAWIGDQTRIFFSTRFEADRGNLFTATLHEPAPVGLGPSLRGSHVSVSHCGRYFLVDDGADGVPLTVGSLSTGRHTHLAFTSTVNDGTQASHAHPYLTADNRWAVFTSNRVGHSQVFGALLPDGLLASLD